MTYSNCSKDQFKTNNKIIILFDGSKEITIQSLNKYQIIIHDLVISNLINIEDNDISININGRIFNNIKYNIVKPDISNKNIFDDYHIMSWTDEKNVERYIKFMNHKQLSLSDKWLIDTLYTCYN